MQKLKKILATALLGSLAVMQVMPVSAAGLGSGGTAGDGTVEAYVDTDIYNVVLPTVADVNFTVDPQGLLHVADAATYATASGAIYFAHPVAATYTDSTETATSDGSALTQSGGYDSGTTYYLYDTVAETYTTYSETYGDLNLPADPTTTDYDNDGSGNYKLYVVNVAAHNTYSDTSEPMEIVNKSSLAVDVDFQVTTTIAGIDMVAAGDLAAATDPSLALEISSTFEAEAPVTASILTTTYDTTTQALTDADAGYSIVSHEAEADFPVGTTTVLGDVSGLYYAYLLDAAFTDFSTMSYEISGACNDVSGWGSLDVADGVSLAITWTISAHSEDAAPSIATTTYAIASGTAEDVTVSLGNGALAATAITSVTDGGVAIDAGNYSLTGTTLTFSSAYVDTLVGDGTAAVNKELVVTFNDTAATAVTLTFTADITNAAPSMTAQTYSLSAPADLTFDVDLGLGDSAATTITDVVVESVDANFYSINGSWGYSTTYASSFSIDDANTVTISNASWLSLMTAGTYDVYIVFDGDTNSYVNSTITVTP